MPRFFFILFLCLSTFLWPSKSLGVEELKEEDCLRKADGLTELAPIDTSELLEALRDLKTVGGKPLLEFSEEFQSEVRDIFDPTLVKTKTEQFYRLLYVMSQHIHPKRPKVVEMDSKAVRQVLVAAEMFPTANLPEQIQKVRLDRTQEKDPRYAVTFQNEFTDLPLNSGEGLYAFTHGRCQKTTKLLFYKNFSFSLRKLENGNLLARYFRGVDFVGDFGTRGVVDIDFEYVAIKSVEFHRGTRIGEVTAAISPMEFEKNDHNFILRIITKFVKNSSVQPLGW